MIMRFRPANISLINRRHTLPRLPLTLPWKDNNKNKSANPCLLTGHSISIDEWPTCAVQLARRGGARVIGTVRSSSDEETAKNAGAHEVLRNDQEFRARMAALAPDGIDHIVEVAFGANIEGDVELLKMGGSIATYATDSATPKIPFWQMVFKNIGIYFLGSDDFPMEAKIAAGRSGD